MRTKRYIHLPHRTLLTALCAILITAFTASAGNFSTTEGESATGEIAFTTDGSVFVNIGNDEVARLKKKELTPDSEAMVTAWEASHPASANMSTKFDNKPQPLKMKSPERSADIAKETGIVMLAVLITETGVVDNAFVKDSSDSRFNGPSLAAMKAWEFAPLTKDSQPTRGLMFVPLQY